MEAPASWMGKPNSDEIIKKLVEENGFEIVSLHHRRNSSKLLTESQLMGKITSFLLFRFLFFYYCFADLLMSHKFMNDLMKNAGETFTKKMKKIYLENPEKANASGLYELNVDYCSVVARKL